MTCRYFLGFNVADLNPGTFTLSTSGKPPVVVDLATLAGADQSSIGSQLFWHYQVNGTFKIQGEDPDATTRLGEWSSISLGRALRTALRAIAADGSHSWGTAGSSIDVTGYYVISSSSAISGVFSNSVGRALFGFTSDPSTPSTTLTSQAVPTHMIECTLPMTSQHSVDYEPASIASDAVADDGSGYGITRDVSPLYRDWIQQFEVKAKCKRLSMTSAHPCTFQDLFEKCRTVYPFIVSQGFGEAYDEAFTLRAEGASFKPERAGADKLNDAVWHVPFKTRLEGKVVQTS